ncbi:hypothetical protein F5144DRAFT_202783 [Chaetomium tenue]|uniref:Uncharacterized protein n=1 Tax=Chaetomium tenue TaxID=1854479 RepID=A0ACB7PDX7_9PEZI|nr:hypothetical protein F5144DRAFT_202783 [Chaetomium globosum]
MVAFTGILLKARVRCRSTNAGTRGMRPAIRSRSRTPKALEGGSCSSRCPATIECSLSIWYFPLGATTQCCDTKTTMGTRAQGSVDCLPWAFPHDDPTLVLIVRYMEVIIFISGDGTYYQTNKVGTGSKSRSGLHLKCFVFIAGPSDGPALPNSPDPGRCLVLLLEAGWDRSVPSRRDKAGSPMDKSSVGGQFISTKQTTCFPEAGQQAILQEHRFIQSTYAPPQWRERI